MHIKNLGVFTKAGNLLMSIDKKTVIREGIEPFHNITKWFKIAGFLKFRYSEKAKKIWLSLHFLFDIKYLIASEYLN